VDGHKGVALEVIQVRVDHCQGHFVPYPGGHILLYIWPMAILHRSEFLFPVGKHVFILKVALIFLMQLPIIAEAKTHEHGSVVWKHPGDLDLLWFLPSEEAQKLIHGINSL